MNGLDPSVGIALGSLTNEETSHINSYMICGSLTGNADGQVPPPVAPVPEYATWL